MDFSDVLDAFQSLMDAIVDVMNAFVEAISDILSTPSVSIPSMQAQTTYEFQHSTVAEANSVTTATQVVQSRPQHQAMTTERFK